MSRAEKQKKKKKNKDSLPNQNTECLFVRHVHQQRANEKRETLTVSDLGIIQTECLQHSPKHTLAVSVRVAKHFNTRKTPAEILANETLIRARFTIESLVLLLQVVVARARHALPHNASQRWGDSLANLVGQQRGESGCGLLVVLDESSVEFEICHRRRRQHRVS